MKSVVYYPTGRTNSDGSPERKPAFLDSRHTAGKSIFVNGDPSNGIDSRINSRINAAGDSPENATGYQILIDTMTYIKQAQSVQSFYDLGAMGMKPRDFVPIDVGEGAWASNILTRRTYRNFGDFESGLTRQGSNNTRQAAATASMDSISIPCFQWDASVEYTLMEVQQALQASNWSIIEEKHMARMEMWHLGLQELTFLGTRSKNMEGLFINTATPKNTSLITAYISGLNASGFATFVQQLIAAFWTSSNTTKLPTHFVIPMVDFLGLATPVPGTVTLKPMIEYLKEAFQLLCGPNFKIIGNAYADKINANTRRAYNFNSYALYRYDARAFRMDIPVDYTVTQPATYNNFNFEDVAYAQLTGLGFYKPLETLLFTF